MTAEDDLRFLVWHKGTNNVLAEASTRKEAERLAAVWNGDADRGVVVVDIDEEPRYLPVSERTVAIDVHYAHATGKRMELPVWRSCEWPRKKGSGPRACYATWVLPDGTAVCSIHLREWETLKRGAQELAPSTAPAVSGEAGTATCGGAPGSTAGEAGRALANTASAGGEPT